MRNLDVQINGHIHRVLCDADQTERLLQLADVVSEKAKEISLASPRASETTVLMMTSLMLADELYEARQEAGYWKERMVYDDPETSESNSRQVDNLMERLSRNIDGLSQQLKAQNS